MAITNEQLEMCRKHGVEASVSHDNEKLGIALATLGETPINGLRHPNEKGTCGWYIWCGEELSEEADFFKPLHVSHIEDYLPVVRKYLSLPVGYRFLIADDYEDVWFDESIKNV